MNRPGDGEPADGVRLRPARPEDSGLLNLWSSSSRYTGEFNDFGIARRILTEDVIRNEGLVGAQGGALLVERTPGGTPIGTVSWREVRYGPNPESRAWNIGISLVPEARGKGFGTQAQKMIAEYLFETTAMHRIEAATDIENLAEQRALEKAGFVREGVLRGAQYRGGKWHDLVFYSVVRPARA
jgi:RimJ/RimL family protein N-acetyltransferase